MTVAASPNGSVGVATTIGPGRLHWNRSLGRSRGTIALGHGAGGGVEAADLLTLSRVLPQHGYHVVRLEQPWRVAGRKIAPRPEVLDAAWLELLSSHEFTAVSEGPLVVGGRSAGARVAARTATAVDAVGLLALAFPLHPPGRPESSRLSELPNVLPTLIVQGERDPFGHPEEFGPLEKTWALASVPAADHSLSVPKRAPITKVEALELVCERVVAWLVSADIASRNRQRESLPGGRR